MPPTASAQAIAAFLAAPLDALLARHQHDAGAAQVLALARAVRARVPAYRAHLPATTPAEIDTLEAFRLLPLLSKEDYYRAHPLQELCWDGQLAETEMVALSSGSTGEAAVWPRTAAHEADTAIRFEQVFADSFRARERSTLAVVCFALGTWVGGMFTAQCLRLLALKGYRITTATPGNHPAEIARVLRLLAGEYDQVVLLGYPPFLRDVLEGLPGQGVALRPGTVRLVFAGEGISEAWRTLLCRKLGTDPLSDTASIYGTADAGVLAVETPLSIALRRWIAERADVQQQVFGRARLPMLFQYDPASRFFERHGEELVFSGDGGVPLVRYRILDQGGVAPSSRFVRQLAALGCPIDAAAPLFARRAQLPFVWVFGRTHIAVSLDGANIYPEHILPALERPPLSDRLSGRFVMEVRSDPDQQPFLFLTLELLPGHHPQEAFAAEAAALVRAQLESCNSEFAAYVPPSRRTPHLQLCLWHDAAQFPPGVKHRYVR